MYRIIDLFLSSRWASVCLLLVSGSAAAQPATPGPLPNTKLLETKSDITSDLVAGVDRFLLSELDKAEVRREEFWAGGDAPQILDRNRKRLSHILGLRDTRKGFTAPSLVTTTEHSSLVARSGTIEIHEVRWPAFRDVMAEGLLLIPDGKIVADVIAIPDADVSPEQIAGMAAGQIPPYAKILADRGCRVLVPTLLSRKLEQRNGRATLTDREFIYRSAFELGRHLIGYELQMVLAGVDWFEKDSDRPIGVVGWGEGGMLALYAGATDTRITAIAVSGYVDDRTKMWQHPMDRNVHGLLERFGDGELIAMGPRHVLVQAARGPVVSLPSNGGAPAELKSPGAEDVARQVNAANALVKQLKLDVQVEMLVTKAGQGEPLEAPAIDQFIEQLTGKKAASAGALSKLETKRMPDGEARRQRLLHSMDQHSQWLLTESPFVRQQFMSKLDSSSLEKYQETSEWYRNYFRHEVVGSFGYEPLPFNPHARVAYEKEKWTGYEVVLDVFEDVIAYGILLVPKDIPKGERRPVVVCQHGLEGRPQDIVEGDHPAYHDFAAVLAEKGYVVFAPQNLYIFKDRFRTLQRKANPIKKTLFSVIVPQHQQIVDWLQTLPYVDGERIGFYGLSYGGKSAMRIPPLVADYKLSICSADFNEWVWKNASTRATHSYVWTGEYEIFEFDLGSTFNYSEMAALIAPRPFMVERGHFDGVAPDETVGYEFGKVRHIYQARLGLMDHCEIEWFVGPHTINGKGTFEFLDKHLKR